MLIRCHHVIELSSFDINLGIEDVLVSMERSERQPIVSVADHIAIDPMTGCNLHVSITSQRPVEIRKGRESRKQWAGILCQRAQSYVVDCRAEELGVRKVLIYWAWEMGSDIADSRAKGNGSPMGFHHRVHLEFLL